MRKKRTVLISIAILVFGGLLAYSLFKPGNFFSIPQIEEKRDVELSGWIAWWEESEGLNVLKSHGEELQSVSPYWFVINESYNLEDVSSTTDKAEIVRNLEAQGIEVLPLVNTTLVLNELTPLFQRAASEKLIDQIVRMALDLGVRGVDLDIEQVLMKDKDAFTLFASTLNAKLKQHDLKLAVSIIPQTRAIADRGGLYGVDYVKMGAIADQVNLLVYDFHGSHTGPGPIATLPWLKDVLEYAVTQIPSDKIVVGLPMYGYKWTTGKTRPEPYSYQKFMDSVGKDPKFTNTRDPESAELHYEARGQEAWLSDHVSVIAYMKAAKELGLKRFIIWQIGGMDEALFKAAEKL